MTTDRERALAKLRAWSTPGRRADLLAAAWHAGETTIRVLAEAARVSRPTVYEDLTARGITPASDRGKEGTGMYATITLDGYTGAETEWAQLRSLVPPEDADAGTGAGAREAFRRATEGWMLAKWHNDLVPAANTVAEARMDASTRLERVEAAWNDLDDAAAWQAAHHRYVKAVHQARAALQRWKHLADELARQAGLTLHATPSSAFYRSSVPAEQQITFDADVAATKLARLEAQHAQRRAILAETLGLPTAGPAAGDDSPNTPQP